MSTMIALLLVLSSLVGCAGETLTNVKNALPAPPAGAAFSVELEQYEETVLAEDGAVLAECSYELPVLTVRLEDGQVLESAASEAQTRALAAAETFNTRFAQWKTNPKLFATNPAWTPWPTPTICAAPSISRTISSASPASITPTPAGPIPTAFL